MNAPLTPHSHTPHSVLLREVDATIMCYLYLKVSNVDIIQELIELKNHGFVVEKSWLSLRIRELQAVLNCANYATSTPRARNLIELLVIPEKLNEFATLDEKCVEVLRKASLRFAVLDRGRQGS